MNPATGTFSEEDLETESGSFESRIYVEIERTKQKLRELQPSDEEITFYTDCAGVVKMVIGETPDHIFSNEFEKAQFEVDSDTYFYLRKLEDLAYAKEHGEFPEEKPMHEIADPEDLPY